MSDNFVLSIDFGTQSVRTIIYDRTGAEQGKAKVPFEPYFSLQSGWAEQYAETYWENLVKALHLLKKNHKEAFENIKAIGVTTIRDTLTFVDKDNKVLRPFLVWLDERECSNVEDAIPASTKVITKLVGMYDIFCNIRKVTKMNWVRENETDVWKNTHKITQLSGYINMMLTGRLLDSISSQIGHIPIDYKKQSWQKDRKGLTAPLYDADGTMMCDLVDPTQTVGFVTAEASAVTGLCEGLPVIACGSDKGCETFGTGTIGDGKASVSLGTTATIQFTTDKYVEPETFMPAYPAVIKGKFNPEVEIFRGFWMVTWFKDQFGKQEVDRAAKEGGSAEKYLDLLLDEAPVGCEGLVLQAYWSPKIKTPGAKGSIVGFSDVHTRAHLYRSIIEGIGFGLYEGLMSMQKRAKYSIDTIMISGGGSISDRVCQIMADILGIPVKKTQTYENSALGCAMLTYIGTGIFKSYDDALKNMLHDGVTYAPNMKNHEQYMMLYHTVYERIYRKNRKTFLNIRAYNRQYPVPKARLLKDDK